MPILFLLALILGLPLVEIYVMIRIGAQIGALSTIALTLFTAVVGVWLVRLQGLGLLLRVRDQLDRGEVPALEILDGLLILVAGLFLLLPGILTDTTGFLLLIPPLRRFLVRRFVRMEAVQIAGRNLEIRERRVIEGRWRRED